MTAFQLNLFPNENPTPIHNTTHKTAKPRSHTHIIPNCTTEQAAILLGVSTSTLYRARKEGKPYQKGVWTAKALGTNIWSVTHTTIESR